MVTLPCGASPYTPRRGRGCAVAPASVRARTLLAVALTVSVVAMLVGRVTHQHVTLVIGSLGVAAIVVDQLWRSVAGRPADGLGGAGWTLVVASLLLHLAVVL